MNSSGGSGRACYHLHTLTPSQDGVTPLYRACEKGQKEVAKVLLEHGADVVRPCRKVRLEYVYKKVTVEIMRKFNASCESLASLFLAHTRSILVIASTLYSLACSSLTTRQPTP